MICPDCDSEMEDMNLYWLCELCGTRISKPKADNNN